MAQSRRRLAPFCVSARVLLRRGPWPHPVLVPLGWVGFSIPGCRMSIREPRIPERLFVWGLAMFGAYGLGAITMLGLMVTIGGCFGR